MSKVFEIIGGIGCAIIILVVLIGASLGIEYAGYKWYQPWVANQKTHVTRQTNQYVTTQQAAIATNLKNFQDGDRALTILRSTPVANQNKVLIDQYVNALSDDAQAMCTAANMIDTKYVPEAAKPIMMQAGCWTP